MKHVKAIIIALVLTMAGVVYASADSQSTMQKCSMMKTASCCKADADCCAAGAACCTEGAACCKTGADCCAADGCKADAACCVAKTSVS